MGKHRSREAPRGRYQQVDLTSMTPPTARTLGSQLLSHHGSLSSADSSTLYNASSHPTSPLLSQRSPMHQLRQPRHTGVNRHGVVMPLEDDDDQVASFPEGMSQGEHRARYVRGAGPSPGDSCFEP